ncbi:FliI/YscN family ATPase [Limnohabitans sp. 2KL-3]|uniref:FliI/YscN family ATPase n=1 Tax=Limnohabitans sp. 2KL-3 TaxID=1100700 RepID=UPI000ACB5A01|nr:FliI/YscN family ATPase [Limnohabitans sp. 2KL-3]
MTESMMSQSSQVAPDLTPIADEEDAGMRDLHSFDGQNPLLDALGRVELRLQRLHTKVLAGKVVEAIGTVVKVALPGVGVGDLCEFRKPDGRPLCFGEVVGFAGELAVVAVLGESQGISAQIQVFPAGAAQSVEVSEELQGRILDGMGRLSDGGPPLTKPGVLWPIYNDPPPPMTRKVINKPLPMRVRVLDGLLTVGEGQRVGVFAAAGVGKSTILSQLVKGADVDIRVIALIGERGREVREFVEHSLGPEGMAKSIVVCATSDRSSLERARAAYLATSIAEYFRDQDKKVLLLMDSVTRFARALREIGLSAGEPPARQGFPPSVFSTLPRLLERSGMGPRGSITALYTVLVEGDDMTEPIADETRSILDGHIILSRDLAAANHFPAVDVLASASRVMSMIDTPDHLKMAGRIRELMSAYKRSELLVKIGEYKKGADPLIDEALDKWPRIQRFLRQATTEFTDFDDTQNQLRALVN